jgi:aminotransferase
MTKIHQYTMLCAPITAQVAAIEALRRGEQPMLQMRTEYNRRRRLMLEGLRSMGLNCFEPKGAFYIFPSVKETGMSALQFAEELLMSEKVALVPGDAFGESGEGFVRCSYASSVANLSEALERIERFVKKRL